MEKVNIEDLFIAFNKENKELANNEGCMRCGCQDFINNPEGFRVCVSCGTETNSSINEEAEWNAFNSDISERCEYNDNTLLHSENMSTQISFKRNMKHSDWAIMKWQRTFQLNSKDRSLIKVYNRIENQCTLHDIKSVIIERTKCLYKFISSLKLSRGAVREAMLASCLFYAFIDDDNPRNIEEVALVFEANPKKVNKTNKILSNYLWNSDNHKQLVVQSTNSEQIIHRYCNKININQLHVAQIVKLASKYEKSIDMIGKDCSYVAALAIYNYNIKHNLQISKDDICEACYLSTVTLNKLLKKDIS